MGSSGNERRNMEATRNAELEWIRFREDALGEHAFASEPTSGKLMRKIKENPFVPIGCMATLGALGYGLWSFRQGKQRQSQMMMRMRIAAQGFTVVALLAGLFMSAASTSKKNS